MDFEVKERKTGIKCLTQLCIEGTGGEWEMFGRLAQLSLFIKKQKDKRNFNKKQHFKYLLLNN